MKRLRKSPAMPNASNCDSRDSNDETGMGDESSKEPVKTTPTIADEIDSQTSLDVMIDSAMLLTNQMNNYYLDYYSSQDDDQHPNTSSAHKSSHKPSDNDTPGEEESENSTPRTRSPANGQIILWTLDDRPILPFQQRIPHYRQSPVPLHTEHSTSDPIEPGMGHPFVGRSPV